MSERIQGNGSNFHRRLPKKMPNRFSLVVVAANRARQLMSSSVPLVDSKNKIPVIALREIAEGKVVIKGESSKEPAPENFLDDLDK